MLHLYVILSTGVFAVFFVIWKATGGFNIIIKTIMMILAVMGIVMLVNGVA